MQCPACDHDASSAEFGEPPKCPACGVYYHKALAHKERMARRDPVSVPESAAESDAPSFGDKLLLGFISAKNAVEEGRRNRAVKESQAAHIKQRSAPLAVAVVDLQMPFLSMVWFMVKLAIAAIPALIILSVLMFAVSSFFYGFIGGFIKYSGL